MPGIDSRSEFAHLWWRQIRRADATRQVRQQQEGELYEDSPDNSCSASRSTLGCASARACPRLQALLQRNERRKMGLYDQWSSDPSYGSRPRYCRGPFCARPAWKHGREPGESVGGGVAHEALTGTVTTNPDCTAKYTISVYDDSGNLVRTSVLDAVFTNGGRKARVIFESIVLPSGASLPSVLSIEGEKQ